MDTYWHFECTLCSAPTRVKGTLNDVPFRLCAACLATRLPTLCTLMQQAGTPVTDSRWYDIIRKAGTMPFTEAPISMTIKGTLEGREILVTIRGELAQLQTVLKDIKSCVQQLDPADEPMICPKHEKKMFQFSKDGDTWFAHKNGDSWCYGLPPANPRNNWDDVGSQAPRPQKRMKIRPRA